MPATPFTEQYVRIQSAWMYAGEAAYLISHLLLLYKALCWVWKTHPANLSSLFPQKLYNPIANWETTHKLIKEGEVGHDFSWSAICSEPGPELKLTHGLSYCAMVHASPTGQAASEMTFSAHPTNIYWQLLCARPLLSDGCVSLPWVCFK